MDDDITLQTTGNIIDSNTASKLYTISIIESKQNKGMNEMKNNIELFEKPYRFKDLAKAAYKIAKKEKYHEILDGYSITVEVPDESLEFAIATFECEREDELLHPFTVYFYLLNQSNSFKPHDVNFASIMYNDDLIEDNIHILNCVNNGMGNIIHDWIISLEANGLIELDDTKVYGG